MIVNNPNNLKVHQVNSPKAAMLLSLARQKIHNLYTNLNA